MTEIVFAKSSTDYSKSPGSGVYGEYDKKVRIYMTEESDKYDKSTKNIVDKLYVVEKSNASSEAILGETNFGIFDDVAEGARAVADTVKPMFDKFIVHHEFKKSFEVTKTMMEDAKNGIAAEAKIRAKNFARAYCMTRNKMAAAALYNGTEKEMSFASGTYDISTADDRPLFSTDHRFVNETIPHQSNYFKATVANTADLENTLSAVSINLRNFKDESGEPMGYVPNTIILPGNRGKLETMLKKVVGSERTAGTNNNDIGLQYGNWDIVVMADWVSDEDVFIVMSTDARDALYGSVLYDRVPLTITHDIEHLTGNHVWVGRGRMGIGHHTWKHVAMVTLDPAKNATELVLA